MEVKQFFALVENIFTRQLAQAFSEHKVLTKVEAYSHTITVQKDIENKISSVLTQQHVAQILEAQILEDINKSNHARSPDSTDITRQTTPRLIITTPSNNGE